MRNRSKQEAFLAATEDKLRRLLLSKLSHAAESGADLFTNSEFNPHDLLQAHLPAFAEQALQLSRSALALRGALELPEEGPAACTWQLAESQQISPTSTALALAALHGASWSSCPPPNKALQQTGLAEVDPRLVSHTPTQE